MCLNVTKNNITKQKILMVINCDFGDVFLSCLSKFTHFWVPNMIWICIHVLQLKRSFNWINDKDAEVWVVLSDQQSSAGSLGADLYPQVAWYEPPYETHTLRSAGAGFWFGWCMTCLWIHPARLRREKIYYGFLTTLKANNSLSLHLSVCCSQHPSHLVTSHTFHLC